MIDIPKDIPNKQEFSQLKKQDKAIVAFAVLMGVSNQEAFMRYNPHYMRADGKGMNEAGVQASRQFWGWGKIKDYRAEYEKVVEEYIGGGKSKPSESSIEIDGKRKDKALKSLLSRAMSLVEGGTELDAEGLKTVSDIFKRLNLIKEDVEEQEKPRRYIPLRCGECEYCSVVESYVESGEIENTCLRCKALDIAKENGFRYDPKTLLHQPKENTNSNV